jgi:hypothetical protein
MHLTSGFGLLNPQAFGYTHKQSALWLQMKILIKHLIPPNSVLTRSASCCSLQDPAGQHVPDNSYSQTEVVSESKDCEAFDHTKEIEGGRVSPALLHSAKTGTPPSCVDTVESNISQYVPMSAAAGAQAVATVTRDTTVEMLQCPGIGGFLFSKDGACDSATSAPITATFAQEVTNISEGADDFKTSCCWWSSSPTLKEGRPRLGQSRPSFLLARRKRSAVSGQKGDKSNNAVVGNVRGGANARNPSSLTVSSAVIFKSAIGGESVTRKTVAELSCNASDRLHIGCIGSCGGAPLTPACRGYAAGAVLSTLQPSSGTVPGTPQVVAPCCNPGRVQACMQLLPI